MPDAAEPPPLALRYAEPSTERPDDLLRPLAGLAFVYGLFHAVARLAYELGFDRSHLLEWASGWIGAAHHYGWPRAYALLLSAVWLLTAAGAYRACRSHGDRVRLLRVGARATLALILLNAAEQTAASIAAEWGWVSLSGFGSTLGVPGLLVGATERVALEMALPLAVLLVLPRGGIDGGSRRPSRVLLGAILLSFLGGGATVALYVLENGSPLYSFVAEWNTASAWYVGRPHLVRLAAFFIGGAMFAVGAIPALLRLEWGRRLLLTAAWLQLVVVLLHAILWAGIWFADWGGLLGPPTDDRFIMLVRRVLYTTDSRLVYAGVPVVLVVVLSRPTVRSLFR